MELDSENVMVVELEQETEIANCVPGSFASDEEASDSSVVPPAGTYPGVLVGTLAAWDESGNPLVDYPENPTECFLPARTTVPLKQSDRGHEVALLLINGDRRQPLIIGLLKHTENPPVLANSKPPMTGEIDGERLVFTAKKEIVLQCGAASLTLTKAGKVLIRGTYLFSRSSGVNRIKGGSVQIN
jgi:hypothetical protein